MWARWRGACKVLGDLGRGVQECDGEERGPR